MEIWNLVFMQFYRDEKGEMHKLPRPSIDTGMGLERIATVLQGVHSNYDIDLFKNLLAAAKAAVESVSTVPADINSPSLKVIADHIRACAFCVADGVVPGNEGRACATATSSAPAAPSSISSSTPSARKWAKPIPNS